MYAKSLEDKVAERTQQLEVLTRIDPLTNLYNQRAMYESLRKELLSAKRNHFSVAMVYFDVDHFKRINDNEGHAKGDEVLHKLGQIMLEKVREFDIACRYGGDECVLILPNCDRDNAQVICRKIITEFEAIYPSYTLSIGIAETGPDEFIDSDHLIKNADDKMYEAKKMSGSQIRD